MKLREVNGRLLNKNMINDISKKLSEYPKSIMSIVDFSFATQRIIEKNIQSIAKLSSNGLQQYTSYQRQQQQKDNLQLQMEQITGISLQTGQTLELQRDSVGYMGVLLGATEKMFNDKEKIFSNTSKGAVQELGSVIQDVEQTQNNLQLAGLSEYREEERRFFNQLNLFKECCLQTTKKVDSYKTALVDPSLIYNTKHQLLKWNQLASQYNNQLQMQIGISDHLELFQTKRKAIAINLQELLEQNKQALIKVITLFQRFTQTSAPQFIHLFFFFATYLHDQQKSLRSTKEKSRIKQSNQFEQMPFTAEPQVDLSCKMIFFCLGFICLIKRDMFDIFEMVIFKIEQFMRYLDAQTKFNDQQLIGFSEISAVFITAIQKQSLQRQEEINRSLKYLEGLKSCYDISAKNLKELLTEFESKNKHTIIKLMGKESAVLLNNLLNSVQIVSSEFYRQSKIIQVASQQISYHLSTLQNCHNQVFTGLNRSLQDHSNIKNEFKRALETIQSSVVVQNERVRMQQSVPLLKECFVYILQDYQRINQKELNGVRDCQWNIIIQLEQSCRDLISHSEKITENNNKNSGLEDLSNSPVLLSNTEHVNTKLIESFVQNTLETDKVFSVFHVELKDEINGLGKDFEKTEFFDYQIVESLTPPQGIQPLVGPRIREQQRTRSQSYESFVSFEVVSDNEEEKISERQHDSRQQSKNSEEYFYSEKKQKVNNQGESTRQQHQSESKQGSQAQQQNQSAHHVSTPQIHHHNSVQESQTKKEELIQYEKFIKQRTIWSEGEELKHHFSCAFAQSINLQGRIYITNLRLIFHSYFNGNTIFFNETLLEIPKSDILIIHKRKNMLFLDNAIQIDVIKGSLLFTQFIYRDAAFDAIVKVLQPSQMRQMSMNMLGSQMRKRTLVEINEDVNIKGNSSIRIDSDIEDEQESDDCTEQEIQQQIAQRRENIQNGMKQNDSFKHVLMQTVLKGENISIKDLFQSCLSDNSYVHQGEGQQQQQQNGSNSQQSQIYQNYFFYYIKNVMKCWDITIENWSPPPPAYFLKSSGKDAQREKQEEKVQKWLEISQRQINYNKGIPFSGIPFIPKSCHVQEKQKVYFISVDELVFELEVYSSGVPMADSFYLIIRNSFAQTNPDSISYKVEMDVRILKSTWLSATLESQCIKEGQISSNTIAQYFQERINEFMKSNMNKNISNNSQIQDDKDILRSSTNLHESQSGEKKNNNNRNKYTQQSSQDSLKQPYQQNSKKSNQQTQQLTQSVKERETRILKTIDPIQLYTTKLFEMQLGDSKVEITPFDAFQCLFGDDTTLCKGYSDPYQCLKVDNFKDTKYSTSKWDPPLVDIFKVNKHNDNSLDSCKREVQFVHHLPPSNIPFMPKECSIKEIQTCYQISDKLVIMNSEVFTSGVPKGDSFTAKLRMIFEQISPNVIRYSQYSYMNFIKSTFLQGAIEKASIEQQKIAAGVIQQFTSELINSMLAQKRQQVTQNVPGSSNILKRLSSLGARNSDTNSISAKTLAEMEHRKRRILSSMESNDKFSQKVIEKSFSTASATGNSNVSLQEFIHLVFSESLPFEGSSDFLEYIKVIKSADKEYASTSYNPPFPGYFASQKISSTEDNLQDLLKSVDMSERQISYTHPMPPTSIPFMPKTCKIKEIHKIYFISPDLVVLNIEVFTSGVPKCDSFSVRMRQIFRYVPQEQRIEFTLLAYVQFFENTILAGKIQQSAIEQQTLSAQNITVPNYENAMNLLRNKRQSKETPKIMLPNHTKNQYSLHRIQSIHLTDDGEERISPADCSPNFQPQGSNVFKFQEQQRQKVQQRRSSITKKNMNNNSTTDGGVNRTLSQQDQVVKLTENIESMNSKFKLFVIGFVVIYVTTLIGFLLKS